MARRTLDGLDVVVLDERASGYQVIGVGGHRVVLPDGSRTFRPVLTCVGCNRAFASFRLKVESAEDLRVGREASWCGTCLARRWASLQSDGELAELGGVLTTPTEPYGEVWYPEDPQSRRPDGDHGQPEAEAEAEPEPEPEPEPPAPSEDVSVLRETVAELLAIQRNLTERLAEEREAARERDSRARSELHGMRAEVRELAAKLDSAQESDRSVVADRVEALGRVTGEALQLLAGIEASGVQREERVASGLQELRAVVQQSAAMARDAALAASSPAAADGEGAASEVGWAALSADLRERIHDRLDLAVEAAAAERAEQAHRLDAVAQALARHGAQQGAELAARLDQLSTKTEAQAQTLAHGFQQLAQLSEARSDSPEVVVALQALAAEVRAAREDVERQVSNQDDLVSLVRDLGEAMSLRLDDLESTVRGRVDTVSDGISSTEASLLRLTEAVESAAGGASTADVLAVAKRVRVDIVRMATEATDDRQELRKYLGPAVRRVDSRVVEARDELMSRIDRASALLSPRPEPEPESPRRKARQSELSLIRDDIHELRAELVAMGSLLSRFAARRPSGSPRSRPKPAAGRLSGDYNS